MHEPKTRDTPTTNTLTSEARRAKRAEMLKANEGSVRKACEAGVLQAEAEG
jgi:hypothetical protein